MVAIKLLSCAARSSGLASASSRFSGEEGTISQSCRVQNHGLHTVRVPIIETNDGVG